MMHRCVTREQSFDVGRYGPIERAGRKKVRRPERLVAVVIPTDEMCDNDCACVEAHRLARIESRWQLGDAPAALGEEALPHLLVAAVAQVARHAAVVATLGVDPRRVSLECLDKR
eukprot:3446655-Prymnesium_polylepis.1